MGGRGETEKKYMSTMNMWTSPQNIPKSSLTANVRSRCLFLLIQVLSIFIVSIRHQKQDVRSSNRPSTCLKSKNTNPKVNEFVKKDRSLFYFCISESLSQKSGFILENLCLTQRASWIQINMNATSTLCKELDK